MKILYLGYWSIREGLSESTVRPHLEQLDAMDSVSSIIFVSMEREMTGVKLSWHLDKVEHMPVNTGRGFMDKVSDFVSVPHRLAAICRSRKIDLLICRSAPAGTIGYLVHRKCGVPFVVESFEPHAGYMLETGVWSKWGLSYNFQKLMERKQVKTAEWILPLTNSYAERLRASGTAGRMAVLPCTVDMDMFRFSPDTRTRLREEMDIADEEILGIYVGKLGGLYYKEEAIEFLLALLRELPGFRLLVLSASQGEWSAALSGELARHKSGITIRSALHREVPGYLSAADLAFGFYKSHKYSYAQSPVKNGEYLANGLPVILPPGIGDDSGIIEEGKLGFVTPIDGSVGEHSAGIKKMVEHMNRNRRGNEAVRAAMDFRHRDRVREVYTRILEDFGA